MQFSIYVGDRRTQPDRVAELERVGFPVSEAVAKHSFTYDDGDNGVQPTIRFESFVYEDGTSLDHFEHEHAFHDTGTAEVPLRKRKKFNPRTDQALIVERTVPVSKIDHDLLMKWVEEDKLSARLPDYERGYRDGYRDAQKLWSGAKNADQIIAEADRAGGN